MSAINVAYDYQIFSLQEYGGVSRYYYELAKHIHKYPAVNSLVLAPLYVNQYLRNGSSINVYGKYFPKIARTGRIVELINRVISSEKIKSVIPDILHQTYYSTRISIPERTKVIVTVFDMVHEKYPEQFPSSRRITEEIKRSVLQADHVICISESTRNDLIDIVEVSPEKVSVVYLGHSLQKAVHMDRNISIPYPFILYVGKRDGYKNFDRLLQAYKNSRTIYMNYKLVCFGGGKFSSKENEKIGAFPVQKKNIIHLDGDDAVLGYLYSKADLFVYPSLYEGFGIPLLEAMSHGVPVVCSNTSSLPEIVGDSAEIVDPYEVDAIAKAMGNVLESSKRRKELIQLGYERIKRFSWDNCAADTYSIYRALV